MTTSAVYPLALNYDGTQNTRYPLGDKPNETTPPVPDNFRAEDVQETSVLLYWDYTDTEHNGFELEQWILGTDNAWRQVATPHASDRQYMALDLPQGIQVGHRLRATSVGAPSAWAPEVWVTTVDDTIPIPPPFEVPTYADANRFVSVDGSGDHSGTDENNAWTLFEACDNCQPGHVIGVKAGRYVGVSKTSGTAYNRFTPSFEPARSGTGSQPITFVAENPAALTTNISNMSELCSGTPQGYYNKDSANGWRGNPAFGGKDKNYIHVVGMYMSTMRPDTGMAADSGVCTFWNGNYVTVSYCRFEGDPNEGPNNYSAIRFEGCENSLVRDNYFTDWGQNSQGSAMKYYGCNFCIFEHNEVYRCETAINPKGWNSGYGGYMYGHRWRYNIIQGCSRTAVFAQAVETGPNGERNWFYANQVTESGSLWSISLHSGGADIGHFAGGCDIFNNTYDDRTVNGASQIGIIYHNVSHRDAIKPADNTFYNNICTQHDGLSGISWTSSSGASLAASWADYNDNCYYQVPYAGVTWGAGGDLNQYPWSSWQNINGEDVDSIFSDPQYVAEYKLAAGSPCRNKGVDREGAFGSTNATIDMGCYPTGTETMGIRTQ